MERTGQQCANHGHLWERVESAERRLDSKHDRIMKLEMEVKVMDQKLNVLIEGQHDLAKGVASFRTLQIWSGGAVAAVLAVYGLLATHPSWVAAICGGS
jgi:phage-related minor tail protein